MDYNMNPDQNENNFRSKTKRFLDKQGFYVVLIACLLILGATALVTYRGLQKEVPQAEATTPIPTWMPTAAPLPANQNLSQSLEDVLTSASPSPSASASPTPTEAPTSTPAAEKESTRKKAPSLYPMPVEGTVSQPFAGDTLVYSKTLDQWTNHPGIDIAGEEGAVVKSIAAGVVDRVDNDPLMGYCITIKHNGDVESLYANLRDLPTLNVGDSVKAGDTLGHIGTSAIAESQDGPHLHFELFVSGKAVDPKGRLTGLE